MTHRWMTAEEADALKRGHPVAVMNARTGEVHAGTVRSFNPPDALNVTLRTGAEMQFSYDPDDFEHRAGPVCDMGEDGQFTLAVEGDAPEATPDDLVIPALANSAPFMRLATRVLRCEAAISQLNQLEVSRAEFAGLVDMVGALRDEVAAFRRILSMKVAS